MYSLLDHLLGRSRPDAANLGPGGIIPGDPTSFTNMGYNSVAPWQMPPTPDAQPSPPPAPVSGPAIDVSADSLPDSKYKEGLIHHGFFSIGHTGGNILGILGDALGGKPIYASHLKDAQVSEALEGLTGSPEEQKRSIMMLNRVDGPAAADLYDKMQTQDQNAARTDAYTRSAADDYEGNTHTRAFSLLGAATRQSYPQIKKQIEAYYAARGVKPLIDLPNEYPGDQEMANLAMGGVSPDKRASLDEQELYHAEGVAQRKAALEHEDNRYYTGQRNENTRFQQGQAGESWSDFVPSAEVRSNFPPGTVFQKSGRGEVKAIAPPARKKTLTPPKVVVDQSGKVHVVD